MALAIGTRVRVKPTGGMSEFHGSTGTVIDHERDGRTLLHRIKLDTPVKIKGLGTTTDDLWAAEHLDDIDGQE